MTISFQKFDFNPPRYKRIPWSLFRTNIFSHWLIFISHATKHEANKFVSVSYVIYNFIDLIMKIFLCKVFVFFDVKCLTFHWTFLCLQIVFSANAKGKIDPEWNLVYWSLKLKKCWEISTITLRLNN